MRSPNKRWSHSSWSQRSWYGAIAATLFGLMLVNASHGNTRDTTAKRDSATPRKVAADASKRVRQRLPAYFSKVVTVKQRQQIYKIQAGYRKQIERLQDQLSQLLRQRDQEVDLVLSPEQLEQIQTLRAAAAARRKNRRASQVSPQKSSPKSPATDNP